MSKPSVRTERTVQLIAQEGGVGVVITTETIVSVPLREGPNEHLVDVLAVVSDALGRLVTEAEAQELGQGLALVIPL